MAHSEEISAGANGIILPCPNGALVRKKLRRGALGHSIENQMHLHRVAQSILRDENNFTTLRVPYLSEMPIAGGPAEYWMERIDTSRPLWLGDEESVSCYPNTLIYEVERELARYWQQMWEQGYAPWDFELYVQRDNTVVMLDFDKYAHRLTNTSHYAMPPHIHIAPELFFQHASFPQGFEGAVGNPFRVSRLH